MKSLKTVAILIAIFTLSSNKVKSQLITCPFNFNNFLDCSVTLQVQLLEDNLGCSFCTGVGNNVTITIPPSSTYVLNCADFAIACTNSTQYCDISITMTSPVALTPVGQGGSVSLASLPGGCGVSSTSQMNVSAGNCDLNK
jgi:hypothetical protein